MAIPGVEVSGGPVPGTDRVLTDDALAFVADLQRRFKPLREDLLQRRHARDQAIRAGTRRLGFLAETAAIREDQWSVAPAPADLDDRRVEITGPAEPKMMINALNSGARVFMADLEDALSPTWAKRRRWAGGPRRRGAWTLVFESPEGKSYRLAERWRRSSSGREAGTLSSPTSWSTASRSSGSLFDAGLYLFHNAAERLRVAAARTSTSPSSNRTTRRASGTRCSSTPRKRSGIPRGSVGRPS
jgi:malate synthase